MGEQYIKIETTHLQEKSIYNKEGSGKYRWFESHFNNCNAAKLNNSLDDLVRCDCNVFYERIEI